MHLFASVAWVLSGWTASPSSKFLNYLTPPCKNRSFLSPRPKKKSYTPPPNDFFQKKTQVFFWKNTSTTSHLPIYLNGGFNLTDPPTPFPYRASVQQGASEAHGFRLQTDEKRPDKKISGPLKWWLRSLSHWCLIMSWKHATSTIIP